MKCTQVVCADCGDKLEDAWAQCPKCGGWERLATFRPKFDARFLRDTRHLTNGDSDA